MRQGERKSKTPLLTETRELDALLSPIALAKEEAPVPSDLWSRIEAEVMGDPGVEPIVFTELLGDGEWRQVTPGVAMKQIWGGAARLVRCDPGASIKAHSHRSEERLMIVAGTANFGDLKLEAGDTQVSPPGSNHPELTTPTGCLFIIQKLSKAA